MTEQQSGAGHADAENDERYKLAYDESVRALGRQADRVTDIRARASSLLGSGSLAASFLGTGVLRDRAEFGAVAWLGVGAFVGLALITAWLLLPKTRKNRWVFVNQPVLLIKGYVEAPSPKTLTEMWRDVALWSGKHYEANERRLNWMNGAAAAACILLAVEVVALLVDLVARR